MKNGRPVNPLFQTLIPFLIIVGAILLFFSKMAFSNLILARGDIFLYFYPYWHMAADALREGRIPLWNPNIFMGAPFLANSQVGFFYPFNWPVWLGFDTPSAVKTSIIFHLMIAGLGTYWAGRKVMDFGRSASLVAAISFSLGGYLTAQVEHINQLQGLSWLPWFLVVLSLENSRDRGRRLFALLALAILFALQLLAGHTQTAFITGVGLILWEMARLFWIWVNHDQDARLNKKGLRTLFHSFLPLLGAVILALLITAVQLLPTLELSKFSSRQGGLPANEVLSFSLPPLHLSRTLLPAFNQSLFTEYVAFLPLIILALALIGAWQWRRTAAAFQAVVWTVAGFLLALGVYNPIYWLLARVPGFDLFRAPARWMVLYALGVSLLAGAGWQILVGELQGGSAFGKEDHETTHFVIQPLKLFLISSGVLFIWGIFGSYLVGLLPTGSEAPFEAPSTATILLWFGEWLLLAVTFFLLTREKWAAIWPWIPGVLAGAAIIILYIGSRSLPYNHLTTPEAYFDIRPSISRLQAENDHTPNRFLSLSDIFFDAGDQAEIDTIYETQLPESARYDYTIAIKQKEIIAPNLPMLAGLPSVDGFDGGILPIQSYSQMMQLILPEGTETTDGRLREHLQTVPEARWLDLFNTKYLITDKTGDIWRDGVFFDRQHAVLLDNAQTVPVGYLPQYEATELRILSADLPGMLNLRTGDGESWKLTPEPIEDGLFKVSFPTPAVLKELQIDACLDVAQCELDAITLVDARDETFQSLVPGDYKLIHSGDVKIYENLDVLPRAFIVHNWNWVPDGAAAIETMRSLEFDIEKTAVLTISDSELIQPLSVGEGVGESRAEIQEYNPERIVLISDAVQDGLLVLTDSYYPGWQAVLDGKHVPIERANNLFRGVFVPAGRHELVFYLTSQSYNNGRVLTLVGLAVTIILAILLVATRTKGERVNAK